MSSRVDRFTFLCSCLLLMSNVHAHAENHPGASPQLQLGLATSVSTGSYRDIDEEYYFIPLVMAEYGRCYLEISNVGCRVYQGARGQQLAIEIDRTFDGFASGDSNFLTGMAERRSAWEAGLVYQLSVGGGQLTGKLMSDISNTHEGYSTRFDYERPFWQDEAHMLTWFFGGEYWDRAKTDYYFGVDTSEARPDRLAYSAPDSHRLFAGGNAFKQLNPEIALFVSVEYTSASEEIADSPLVTRGDEWLSYGGFFYQF